MLTVYYYSFFLKNLVLARRNVVSLIIYWLTNILWEERTFGFKERTIINNLIIEW